MIYIIREILLVVNKVAFILFCPWSEKSTVKENSLKSKNTCQSAFKQCQFMHIFSMEAAFYIGYLTNEHFCVFRSET